MSGMADPGVAMRGGLRRRFVERIVEPAVVLAEERSGRVVRCYALAGSIVRVTFAGAPLAERLGRAFAHALLPDHQGSVDLDVHVWDSASNGLPPPAHMLPETEADGLVAADEPGLLAGFVSKEDTLNLIDFERAQAYFWLSSLEAVPGWVTAAPLRRILQWFFAPRDVHLMHGAAVGRRERALLITARGGSGKSTTALAAAATGLGYLADDYVAVRNGAPPEAHCLFNSAKLTDASLAMLPNYGRFIRERDVGERLKSVIFMAEAMPERLLSSAPLVGIAVPVINRSERTFLEPADAKAAFLALAPSSLLHVSLSGGSELMRALRTLVASLPCYRLMLGRDPAEIADALAAFIDRGPD